ncbi:hypothetical protein BaRGS_00012875, partial [Batillaria attramentaria]
FFLKTDDDMWVNVPALLNTVNKEQATLQTALGGSCRVTGTKPHRNVKSKWYASYNAYPQPTYPGFCSGTGYVSSLNLARHVISVSPDVPFFHLEDVYVSLCIQRLGKPFRLRPLRGFMYRGSFLACRLKSTYTITMHQVSPQRLRDTWTASCTRVHADRPRLSDRARYRLPTRHGKSPSLSGRGTIRDLDRKREFQRRNPNNDRAQRRFSLEVAKKKRRWF